MAGWFGIIEAFAHGDKVRNLAVCTDKPVAVYPDVPTFKSKGYNLMSSGYHGVGVPIGTPKEVVQTLSRVFQKIANDPKVRERKLAEAYTPIAMNSAESQALIKAKMKEWTPIVRQFVK